MIDYIEIVKHLTHEDSINFANLEEKSIYPNTDVYRFVLKGCADIEVMFYASSHLLKVKGSFLYFMYGHNFVPGRSRYVKAVRAVEDALGVSLDDAMVEELEYGVVMEVPGNPKDYIKNHKPLPCSKLQENQRPRDGGKYKWFEDAWASLKLYDVKANFAKKLTRETKASLTEYGWKPEANYLKFEAHYKKPHYALNNGRGFTLQELLSQQWESRLKADLKRQYKRLYPMGELYTTDRSAAGILMCSLVNMGSAFGMAKEEVKKSLYECIRGPLTPELTFSDIKARQRQFLKLMKSLAPVSQSPWDLNELLTETLSRH